MEILVHEIQLARNFILQKHVYFFYEESSSLCSLFLDSVQVLTKVVIFSKFSCKDFSQKAILYNSTLFLIPLCCALVRFA